MRSLTFLSLSFFFFLSPVSAQNLQWLTQLNGDLACTQDVYANCIINDITGNVITAGGFRCTTDFDPGTGAFFLSPAGTSNFFIQKTNSSDGFIWAKGFGGTGADAKIAAITTDYDGNIYATGTFVGSVDFDPGPLVYTVTSPGPASSTFVLKLDASGAFIWVKYLIAPTGCDVTGSCIAVDLAGNMYIGGTFWGTVNFNTSGGIDTLHSGSTAGFILKLNAAGNYVWTRKNVSGFLEVTSMVCEDTAGVYYTGSFMGTAKMARASDTISLVTDNSNLQGFVAKLDNDGKNIWAKQFSAVVIGSSSQPLKIRLDSHHRLIVSGAYSGTVDFNTDPLLSYPLTFLGVWSCFTERMDSWGNFLWAKSLGGTPAYYGDVGTDNMCNVFTAGSYMSRTDFNPGTDSFIMQAPTTPFATAGFIQKLDSSGNFKAAFPIISKGSADVVAMSVTGDTYIYIAGGYNDTTCFDAATSTYTPALAGQPNGFAAKYAVADYNGIKPLNVPQVSIYPNPSTGGINIKCSAVIDLIQVTDLTGRVVYSAAPGTTFHSVILCRPGMYFVTAISENAAIVQKVYITP